MGIHHLSHLNCTEYPRELKFTDPPPKKKEKNSGKIIITYCTNFKDIGVLE